MLVAKNRERKVFIFLNFFFYGSKMRKAKRKKEPMLAAKNKERKVCFLNFIFYILYIYIYIFFMGLR